MSEKRTSQSADLEQTQQPTNAAPQAARRRLLKGSVAIPVIMTLHSGAALARTSNLASGVDANEAYTMQSGIEGQDQIVCAELDSPGQEEPPYDLGEFPTATLGDGSLSLGDQGVICQDGGGIMISATAATSLIAKGMTNT